MIPSQKRLPGRISLVPQYLFKNIVHAIMKCILIYNYFINIFEPFFLVMTKKIRQPNYKLWHSKKLISVFILRLYWHDVSGLLDWSPNFCRPIGMYPGTHLISSAAISGRFQTCTWCKLFFCHCWRLVPTWRLSENREVLLMWSSVNNWSLGIQIFHSVTLYQQYNTQ